MRGTFTTRKYESRQALVAGQPFEVVESRNSFTNAGLRWLWDMALGNLRDADGGLTDQLASARIIVGDGDREFNGSDTRLAGEQTDQAAMDAGYPALFGMVGPGYDDQPDTEGAACRLVLRATFGEQQAIFDWQERGVVTAQGVLLDRSVKDQGRKVLGSVWVCEAALDLEQ